MEATLIHNSATRKTLEMVFPAPQLDKAFKEAIANIAPKVKLPGFRPGKTPKSVLLTKFKNEIAKEVAENLMESHFASAIAQIGIQPISRPAIESAELQEGAQGKVKIQFDVAPEVKLPDYKGAKLVKKKRIVDDGYVDKAIEAMRQQAARYVPVEGPAQAGHFAQYDLKVRPQGMKQKLYEGKEMQLEAGKPFDAQLLGMVVGETKNFSLQIPDDDKNRSIGGKQVRYEVKIHDLRSKAVPDLNDEFAKDAGDYGSLSALKKGVRQELEKYAENEASVRLEGEMLDQLLEAAPFEVPSSMVNLQMDDYCRDFAEKLNRMGLDYKKVDWKAYRQRRLNDAERAVRSGYLLQFLGNDQDIQVSEDEIDQEIRKWMAETKSSETLEAVKAGFEKSGASIEIRGRVRTEKIFAMLLGHASISEELLDATAYDSLLEYERRREEGIAQARFDAGGLSDGEYEEQDGGDPDAIKSADDEHEAEEDEEDSNIVKIKPKATKVPKEETAAKKSAEAEKDSKAAAAKKPGRPKKAAEPVEKPPAAKRAAEKPASDSPAAKKAKPAKKAASDIEPEKPKRARKKPNES
jgi:trigger factor